MTEVEKKAKKTCPAADVANNTITAQLPDKK